ncbi:cytochrome d ubiquinol oxidase subunit II [Neomegalonema perideroedes]|uniref:cytochrome d ubiquinol oxidase subunit II n=1 Tax=Neomegalonema perideroedes TaxID=217219 RepID=UPI000371EEC0|nr:cytochrome d ubiquinol oxidase subunit II [Neomegalonema perideroedes]
MVLHELISYDVLRVIWWLLLGVLLVGFAVMDGFDLGAQALLPFVAKTDLERRSVINSIGPVWEGNQVWLILGGGAIFAAWPLIYAAAFSGFYLAMFLLLVTFILRPVAFKFRSKREEPKWRARWDVVLCLSGGLAAILFGAATSSALMGSLFSYDPASLGVTFKWTSFFRLLHPFGLLCGLVSLAMLLAHGAGWLAFKLEGPVAERARSIGSKAALAAAALFVVGGVWVAFLNGHQIVSVVDPAAASNPLRKSVELVQGGWLSNYAAFPPAILAPVLGILGMLGAAWALRRNLPRRALLASGLGITGIVATVGVSIFPFLLPSALDPRSGLTVWDASSSHFTLFVMLGSTLIFMPLILLYTAWVYRILRGKVDVAAIAKGDTHAY